MTSPPSDPSSTRHARPRRRRYVLGTALCLALGLAVSATASASTSSTGPAGGSDSAASATASPTPTATTTPAAKTPTVLVGVAGLRWTDVDAATMPTLWSMIGGGSVASIPGRQATCPRDAWATLSAGREVSLDELSGTDGTDDGGNSPSASPSGDPTAPTDESSTSTEQGCAPLPEVQATTTDGVGPATVADWVTPPVDATGTTSSDGMPGTLGAALTNAGTCTTAIGPGAALMLADSTGYVSRYSASLDALTSADLTACGIIVYDAGTLPDATAERKTARQGLDKDLAQLREMLPRGSRILVAGVVDTESAHPELQVVTDWRSPGHTPRWLTSDSTRRRGVVQLVDLSTTIAQAGGADTKATTGAPLIDGEARRMGVSRTVENLSYLKTLSQTIDTLMPAVVGALAATLICAIGGMLLSRRGSRRRGEPPGPGPHGRRIVTAVLLLAAAVPVAASLAALSRWWVWPAPTLVVTVSVALAAAIVAICAWWISRALPRSPLALAATVSALTWLVLTIDGLTGTTLQQGSILGSSPSLGARFYGFNNMTFAVYATAALILAGAAASFLPRRTGLVLIASIGVVTTVVDGWPEFGADFGGVFALVPAFAVLGLLTARARVTVRRIAAVVGGTILTVVLVAVVDWLSPGAPSHMGAFVQQLVQGDGLDIIGRKALGAWATIANPAGALALVAVLAACFAVLWPRRCRLTLVADAYEAVPPLRPIVVSLVVAALVGSVLNDSGIIIAVMFLLVATATLVCSFLAVRTPLAAAPPEGGELVEDDAGETTSGRGSGESSEAHQRPTPAAAPPTHQPRMTPTLTAAAGGLLVVLLLASGVLTSSVLRPANEVATAGEQSSATSADVLSDGAGIVVVGTTGINWDDVAAHSTPTLTSLLTDGAAAGGVSQPTGAASRCTIGGWLSLSAGQLASVTNTRGSDGYWECPTPTPVPEGDGATVTGWSELAALQKGSSYQAKLGVLGTQLKGAKCATAVGTGAAVALADSDGKVSRYRTLDQALTPGSDAFSCPVTLVDAGDATTPRVSPDLPADERSALRTELRAERLATVDATVADVIDAVPASTTVLVVDVAGSPGARPVLGVALARPGAGGPDQARYLTSSATRSDGIARALDVPATLLNAAGVAPTDPLQDTPFAYGSLRPTDADATASALADLTSRDFVRRDAYVYFVDVPLYLGLALAALCLVVGRARRINERWRGRLTSWARAGALFLAAVPVSAFLVSLTGWWRFDNAGLALAVSALGASAAVAGVAALAPRRPLWLAPGIIAGITFLVLTLDGVLGTPLNRASPLGSAPTFGARFYGFGNPTFSVYAVAAVIFAAGVAQWLVRAGRRWWAVAAVSVIGLVTMIVDVWPTFGADLGGGLVLVPGFAVVAISASGAKVTWRRVLVVAAAGVGAVAAIGVLDWMRPPEERSHLGRFVGQVIDGDAFATLFRKAGYALRSVLGGIPVWLTLVVLIACAVVLFASRRFTPGWFRRAEAEWPLLRSATLGLWIIAVAGSLVNDFGVRIAMIALIPAVPLYTVIGLSALRARGPDAAASTPVEPPGEPAEPPGEPAEPPGEPAEVAPAPPR